MTTNYPSSLDSFTNPIASNKLNNPSHSAQHANENDAIVAIETKLGVDGSAVTTTIDYKLKNTASIDPGHKHTTSSISGQIAPAQGGTGISTAPSKGDIMVGNNSSIYARQTVGADGQILLADSTQANGVRWGNNVVSKFGGTGADGALSIVSGTTTLSIANALYLEKNYASISITGTGGLAFSNPNTTVGSVIYLRSQGNVTVTSSANPVIDLRSLGGVGGTGTSGSNNGTVNASNGGSGVLGATDRRVDNSAAINGAGPGGNGGASMTNDGGAGGTWSGGFGTARQQFLARSVPWLFGPFNKIMYPGGGGESGYGGNANGFTGGNGGAAGQGAGSMYIECAGAYNFTTGTINGSGTAGSAGTAGTTNGGGGGGGGGAGCFIILYATLTADSGTYTFTGGGGGASGGNGGGVGASGGNGTTLRAVNNYFT